MAYKKATSTATLVENSKRFINPNRKPFNQFNFSERATQSNNNQMLVNIALLVFLFQLRALKISQKQLRGKQFLAISTNGLYMMNM